MDEVTAGLLRVSIRAALTEKAESPVGASFAELGWSDVVAEHPVDAPLLLFETRGEVVASVDSLGPLLGSVASERVGSPVGVVVFGPGLDLDGPAARVDAAHLAVDGLVLADPGAATVAVPVGAPGGLRLALVDAPHLAVTRVDGMDPDMGLHRLDGRIPLGAVRFIPDEVAAPLWDLLVSTGRWALAAELVGGARQVIGDAVAYAAQRRQYGRPIGSFQAVQHRLAAAHALVVGASRVTGEAARSGRPWDALVAKCLAGRAAEEACTQAQQVYGAVGFTWEHHFHRFLRRTYILDRLLGDWRHLEVEIGRRLRTSGEVTKIGGL
jgi:hypothetical protein